MPAKDIASTFTGMKWLAVFNGKNSHNGARHSAIIRGTIEETPSDSTIYEVLRSLADHLEELNAEMEYPDSFQITLFTKDDKITLPKAP